MREFLFRRGSRMSEAGIAWRVGPQGVDDFGVAQPPRAGQYPPGSTPPGSTPPGSDPHGIDPPGIGPPGGHCRPRASESIVRNRDGVPGCSAGPSTMPGRGQTSRRNAVTAVGVRLIEAPGAATGARCISASRQTNPAKRGGGLLSWTFICQETFRPRAWFAIRTEHSRGRRQFRGWHGRLRIAR